MALAGSLRRGYSICAGPGERLLGPQSSRFRLRLRRLSNEQKIMRSLVKRQLEKKAGENRPGTFRALRAAGNGDRGRRAFHLRVKRPRWGDKTRVTIFWRCYSPVVIGSDSLVIVKVPDGASVGELVVGSGDSDKAKSSEAWNWQISGISALRKIAIRSRTRKVDAFTGNNHLYDVQRRIARPEGAGFGLSDRSEFQSAGSSINDLMNPRGSAAGAGRRFIFLEPF